LIPPYEWEFKLPEEHLGVVKIFADGVPVGDPHSVSASHTSITITVVLPPTTTVQSIDTVVNGSKSTVLSIYRNSQGERIKDSTGDLSTSGMYSDGVERYIAADPGNIYTSSDESVAVVKAGKYNDNQGVVTPVGRGEAKITVQNGSHRDSVTVTVIEKLCPGEAIKPDGSLNIFKCRRK
jgi:hypothetical protein